FEGIALGSAERQIRRGQVRQCPKRPQQTVALNRRRRERWIRREPLIQHGVGGPQRRKVADEERVRHVGGEKAVGGGVARRAAVPELLRQVVHADADGQLVVV